MGILLFALIGGALAYFGGNYMGLYEGYGTGAALVGFSVGAAVATLVATALRPRDETHYSGPTFD